jgi:hypothetical protein
MSILNYCLYGHLMGQKIKVTYNTTLTVGSYSPPRLVLHNFCLVDLPYIISV